MTSAAKGKTNLVVTAAVLVGLLLPALCRAAERVEIKVDTGRRHQVMQGFGASGAWWPSWVGEYPKEKQEQILDLLFSRKSGIGLSVYRYNLPAGGGPEITRPERRTAQVETAPGKFDLSADRKALEILRGVRERGVERFVLFANSPPVRLTRNGMTSGGERGGSNLKEEAEEAFAEYLVELATRVRDEYGLPHVALSPINEPQWKWGERRRHQEGCHYTPAEAAAVVRKVIEVSERRKTGFRIEAPESGEWKTTMPYAEAMFADPVIDAHIDEIALHSYWTDRATKEKSAKLLRERFPQKHFAMTEYCQMKSGHDLSIDRAIEMAEVIHDDLTIGNVVTWQWWLGVGAGGYNDGLIYGHPRTHKVEPTKRLWALGQYSRFVRPGDTRVDLESSGQAIKATAFASADGARLACVMVNATKEAVAATVVPPADWMSGKASLFVTDEGRDLAKIDVSGEPVDLPARSVGTLLWEK